MKHQVETELQALNIIAEMVMKYAQLHILNIRKEDRLELEKARHSLENIIRNNGYRVNYHKNQKDNIIKL